MERPILNKLDLPASGNYLDFFTHLKTGFIKPGSVLVTMSIGQWDDVLQTAYDKGGILLELDANEEIVAVYKK